MATHQTKRRRIEYEELLGMQMQFQADDASLVREVMVAGQDIYEFVDDIIGWSYLDADLKLCRHLPETHPEWPWMAACMVQYVEPLGEPRQGGIAGTSLEFGDVKLAVTYRTLPYRLLSDADARADADLEMSRYVSREGKFAIESCIIPGSQFVYQGTNVPIPEPPPKLQPTFDEVVTFHQLPAQEPKDPSSFLPTGLITSIDACIGKVNDAVFLGAAAETIILSNVDVKPGRMVNGEKCFDCQFMFSRRNANGATWNKIYRVKSDPEMVKVVWSTDNTKSIYATADMTRLFRFTGV